MANNFFRFKQFVIQQERCAMKVTTDACLFGAWCADEITKVNFANILEIGTGTGLLSLMIAQKNKILIDTVEIDKEAFLQASENIQVSPWKNEIKIFHEDILSFSPTFYDCIIGNPPFYENELRSPAHQKNIAHHSHHLLLKDLLIIIKNKLSAKGYFFLLLPYKRKPEIIQLIEQNNLCIEKLVFVNQSVNHPPFRLMIKGTHSSMGNIEETEIAIRDEENNYTAAFIDLLKDYYLYL